MELKREEDHDAYQLDDGIDEKVDNASYNHMLNIRELLNNGENTRSVANYKSAVQKLMGINDQLPVIPESA